MSKNFSQVKNPFAGAVSFGLAGAAAAALGAVIRGNSVHNEAITVLVGGSVTGAIAGTLGCCIPGRTKEAPLTLMLCLGALESSLALAAALTAPLLGETIMHLGTTWSTIIIDELIASGVIVGGVVGLASVAGLVYGSTKLCQTLYSGTPPVRSATSIGSFRGGDNAANPLDNSLVLPFQNQV